MRVLIALTIAACALAFTSTTKWDAMIDGQAPASDDEILAMYKDWLIFYGKDTSNLA